MTGKRWTQTMVPAALVLVSSIGSAEPIRPVRLAWARTDGAQSCPDEQAMEARLVSRLARNPFADDAERIIEGVVSREGNEWLVRIRERDKAGKLLGSRELEAQAVSCEPVAAGATLAIALAIDPDAILRHHQPEPQQPPAPKPVPPELGPSVPVPAPLEAPAPSRPEPLTRPDSEDRAKLRPVVTARAVAVSGILPRFSGGGEWATHIPITTRHEVGTGMLWLPETKTEDGGFGFGATAGWVGFCRHFAVRGEITLNLCGKFQIGAMHSVVYRLEPTSPGDRFWLAFASGPALRVTPISPLALELGIEGVFPLVRPEFVVRDQPEPVFRPSSMGRLLFFGAGVTIP